MVPLKNSTLLTLPSASAALAENVIVAGAVNKVVAVGEVRLTVGAILLDVLAVATLISTGAEVFEVPALSVARAVKE